MAALLGLPVDVLLLILYRIPIRFRVHHVTLVCKHLRRTVYLSIRSLHGRRFQSLLRLQPGLLHHMPNLSSVDFSSRVPSLDPLRSLAPRVRALDQHALTSADTGVFFTSLTSITASHVPRLTPALIAANASSLVHLSLKFPARIRDRDVEMLPALPALRSLHLRVYYCPAPLLPTFAATFSALTELRLNPLGHIADTLCATSAPHLRRLDLGLDASTAHAVTAWVLRLPSLTSLSLSLSLAGITAAHALVQLTCLSALSLRHNATEVDQLAGALAGALARLPKLRTVAVIPEVSMFGDDEDAPRPPGEVLSLLQRLDRVVPSLTELSCPFNSTDPSASFTGLSLPRMRTLKLVTDQQHDVELYSAVCAAHRAVQQFPSLTSLLVSARGVYSSVANTKDVQAVEEFEAMVHSVRTAIRNLPLKISITTVSDALSASCARLAVLCPWALLRVKRD